jgi:hypothetical protein
MRCESFRLHHGGARRSHQEAWRKSGDPGFGGLLAVTTRGTSQKFSIAALVLHDRGVSIKW